jgi:hypothetical protein
MTVDVVGAHLATEDGDGTDVVEVRQRGTSVERDRVDVDTPISGDSLEMTRRHAGIVA